MAKAKKLKVANERQREIAAEHINKLSFVDGNNKQIKWIVDIRIDRLTLSQEQMGLYWVWMTTISEQSGYEKLEAHDMFKQKYLVTIFYNAEGSRHQKFKDAVDKWHKASSEDNQELAESRMETVLALLSIKNANTKEMAEYMDDIYKDCTNPDTGLGIYLPLPPRSGI